MEFSRWFVGKRIWFELENVREAEETTASYERRQPSWDRVGMEEVE